MNAVGVYEIVQTMGAKELNRYSATHGIGCGVRRWSRRKGLHGKTRGDNGRVLVQFGMIPYVLHHRQNFQILKEALGDLLRFRIVRKVIETEDFTLTGYGNFPIKSGPVNLVAYLKRSELNALRFQLIEIGIESMP